MGCGIWAVKVRVGVCEVIDGLYFIFTSLPLTYFLQEKKKEKRRRNTFGVSRSRTRTGKGINTLRSRFPRKTLEGLEGSFFAAGFNNDKKYLR